MSSKFNPSRDMKKHLRQLFRVSRNFGLALPLCLMVSCMSATYRKGDQAATSMQRAAIEVQAEQRAMDQAVGSLRNLANEPNGDLRGPFKQYWRAVDGLIATARRTEQTARDMEQKHAAYVAQWDQQLQTIDYQHIREVSEARRNEVTNRFEAIQRRYEESQQAVQPLISYLLDIRTALSADLTSAGLNALKSIVDNANENVAKVQTALDGLTGELTNSSTLTSSVAYHSNPQAPAQP